MSYLIAVNVAMYEYGVIDELSFFRNAFYEFFFMHTFQKCFTE